MRDSNNKLDSNFDKQIASLSWEKHLKIQISVSNSHAKAKKSLVWFNSSQI